jgi:hypothetical protein
MAVVTEAARRPLTLPEVLADQAASRPEDTFLLTPESAVNYAAANRRVEAYAAA